MLALLPVPEGGIKPGGSDPALMDQVTEAVGLMDRLAE